jgi:hypothetical protein
MLKPYKVKRELDTTKLAHTTKLFQHYVTNEGIIGRGNYEY